MLSSPMPFLRPTPFFYPGVDNPKKGVYTDKHEKALMRTINCRKCLEREQGHRLKALYEPVQFYHRGAQGRTPAGRIPLPFHRAAHSFLQCAIRVEPWSF